MDIFYSHIAQGGTIRLLNNTGRVAAEFDGRNFSSNALQHIVAHIDAPIHDPSSSGNAVCLVPPRIHRDDLYSAAFDLPPEARPRLPRAGARDDAWSWSPAVMGLLKGCRRYAAGGRPP